jgi:prolyl 4-hydroxylase
MLRRINVTTSMQFIREYQLPETDVCDALIRCFEECRALDCVHRGRLGHQKVRVALKDSYDLSLSNIPPTVRGAYKEVFDAYFTALDGFASDYMDRFPHLRSHTRPCSINEPPNIQHYPPEGGFFEEHYENAGPAVAGRVLTFQTYLNDIQKGGGTRFVYQEHTAKPAKGKTLLWPAGYTHVHCGEVAPAEDKYIITGWWSYDAPPL